MEEKKIKTFTSKSRKGGSRTLDKSGKVIKERIATLSAEATKKPEDRFDKLTVLSLPKDKKKDSSENKK